MRFSPRRCLFLATLTCFLLAFVIFLFITLGEESDDRDSNKPQSYFGVHGNGGQLFLQKLNGQDVNVAGGKAHVQKEVVKYPRAKRSDQSELNQLKKDFPLRSGERNPNYNIHAFYYAWYGNPKFDDEFIHWNHKILPHWDKKQGSKWRKGQHLPPNDVASNFFPELGAYSSKDPDVLAQHMLQFRRAGIGVLTVSWYPPGDADEAGKPNDNIPLLMDIAHLYDIQVNFHIEPYKTRSVHNLRENIEYILQRFGSHPAFYRYKYDGRTLPLFYIYDSYLISVEDWSKLLKIDGESSIRGTPLDSLFIGLVVEGGRELDLVSSGFDGFYTYFASNGFTYGSSWANWQNLANFAKSHNMLFIPSVGPGYIDTEVRPWNKLNTKERNNGKYYESSFKAAVESAPPIISITSFNEWHEGTQIEAAVVKSRGQKLYKDYRPHNQKYYLELTRKWVEKFEQN